jgi:hypothetical protein
MKISEDLRGHFRVFAYLLANGTLDLEVLPAGLDYADVFKEPSALEQAFAIWSNSIDLDGSGKVVNGALANRRAAQYIRGYVEPQYAVFPPFAEWELTLHL